MCPKFVDNKLLMYFFIAHKWQLLINDSTLQKPNSCSFMGDLISRLSTQWYITTKSVLLLNFHRPPGFYRCRLIWILQGKLCNRFLISIWRICWNHRSLCLLTWLLLKSNSVFIRNLKDYTTQTHWYYSNNRQDLA